MSGLWGGWRSILAARSTPLELRGPVLVVAPHPDDETLGAGGLIALARRRGIDVTVVVVTDGAASHPDSPREVLAAQRSAELRRATALLGVEATEVLELGLPDGEVERHVERLRTALGDLQGAWRTVVVPFGIDANPDHRAVNRVALEVFDDIDEVIQYPIWTYHRWAWMRPESSRPLRLAQLVVGPLKAAVTLATAVLDVSEVIEIQRAALAEHVSQTEGQVADRSGGDRLDRSIVALTVRPIALFVRRPAPKQR